MADPNRTAYLDRMLTFVGACAREMSAEELAWVLGPGANGAPQAGGDAIGDVVLRTLLIRAGTGTKLVDKLQSGAELLGYMARRTRSDGRYSARSIRIARYEICPHCESTNVERVPDSSAVRCQNCRCTREVLSA